MPRAAEKITGPTPWDSDFLRQAACRDIGSRRFYPEGGAPVGPGTRELCGSCPTQPDCQEYAVKHEKAGFWGGTTAEERIEIRQERGISVTEPKSVISDWLKKGLGQPVQFGPSQSEVDQLRRGMLPINLEDMVHPADQRWDQADGHDDGNQGEAQAPEPEPAQASDPEAKTKRPRAGWKHSPEARARMSRTMKGVNNPNYDETHSDETRARMSQSKKSENNHRYDQSIDKVRLAIAAHVRGESMRQASLAQGFNSHWLVGWKRKHPERFRALYLEAAEELDRTMLAADIGAFVLEASAGEDQADGHDDGNQGEAQAPEPEPAQASDPEAKTKRPRADKKLSPEARAKISQAGGSEKNHLHDQNTDKVRLAIAAHVRGQTMSEASLEVGMGKGWLSIWKRRHPERFQTLLAQALEEAGLEEGAARDRDLDRVQQAIEIYVAGKSMSEASLEVGMGKGWLSIWKRRHPERFQALYLEAAEELDRNNVGGNQGGPRAG